MIQGSRFRWIITVLAAVCAPLCCCSLDSLFSSCEVCESDHGACHRSCHDDGDDAGAVPPASHHDHSTPEKSKPGHRHKDGGCTCGNERKISTAEGKTQVAFPPVALAYFQPAPTAQQLPCGLLIGSRPYAQAISRPAQTLLRQHCALIV